MFPGTGTVYKFNLFARLPQEVMCEYTLVRAESLYAKPGFGVLLNGKSGDEIREWALESLHGSLEELTTTALSRAIRAHLNVAPDQVEELVGEAAWNMADIKFYRADGTFVTTFGDLC
jgi:hypothetical protein